MASLSSLKSWILLLAGLGLMLILNFNYLEEYLSPGLPAGNDASGHFAISQLYYESHWPKLDGYIQGYFQGFYFPRFYPPLFYQICGLLYSIFPETSRELLFKLLVTFSSILIPSLVALLAYQLGITFFRSLLVLLISCLFLSSNDEISRYMISTKEAWETGLSTQALGCCFLLINLILLIRKDSILNSIGIVLSSAGLFSSNFHVVLVAGLLIPTYTLLSKIFLSEKIPINKILALLLGFISSIAWYFNAFIHRAESPAVPTENFNISQLVLSYLLLFIMSGLLSLVFEKKLSSKLSIFSLSCLFLAPIFSASIEPLGLRLAWQPHRLLAVLNLFLPIILLHTYTVILNFVAEKETWLQFRMKLAGIVGLLILMLAFKPLHLINGKLSYNQSNAVKNLSAWIKNNPAPGYSLIPFTANSDWISPLDIAISHYLPLSGSNSLWGVFRESSFNSILATTLRNLLSTRIESWGIPNYLDDSDYYIPDFENRLKLLSQWGVSRIIVRTENFSEVFPATGSFEVGYKDPYLTLVNLKRTPILEERYENAYILISTPVGPINQNAYFDFAKLAQNLTLHSEDIAPILIFTSCNQVYQKLGVGNWKIACSESNDCCSTKVNSLSDLKNKAELNELKLKIYNRSPKDDDNLIAAPWRVAERAE